MTKEQIIERLVTINNFIDNMLAVAKNPYSAGLKTDQLLTDIKNFINETIDMIKKSDEEQTKDATEEPAKNEA